MHRHRTEGLHIMHEWAAYTEPESLGMARLYTFIGCIGLRWPAMLEYSALSIGL